MTATQSEIESINQLAIDLHFSKRMDAIRTDDVMITDKSISEVGDDIIGWMLIDDIDYGKHNGRRFSYWSGIFNGIDDEVSAVCTSNMTVLHVELDDDRYGQVMLCDCKRCKDWRKNKQETT